MLQSKFGIFQVISMKTTLLSYLLALFLSLSWIGCGKNSKKKKGKNIPLNLADPKGPAGAQSHGF